MEWQRRKNDGIDQKILKIFTHDTGEFSLDPDLNGDEPVQWQGRNVKMMELIKKTMKIFTHDTVSFRSDPDLNAQNRI